MKLRAVEVDLLLVDVVARSRVTQSAQYSLLRLFVLIVQSVASLGEDRADDLFYQRNVDGLLLGQSVRDDGVAVQLVVIGELLMAAFSKTPGGVDVLYEEWYVDRGGVRDAVLLSV
jgi:hypothetical protein